MAPANCSVPMTSATAFDHLSELASYHCFNKTNCCSGTPSACIAAQASPTICCQCSENPGGPAAPISALCSQLCIAALSHCFDIPVGSGGLKGSATFLSAMLVLL